jgi:mono/diheme cytochrome c family protein
VIFVMLSGFDWFFRSDLQAMKVDASEMVQSTEAVDFKPLVVSSADQVAKGNKLYAQNCATCHGAEGLGNGPAAGALNPKPRNFTVADGWKNGRTVALVFKTLTNGIPGSPMPAFAGLSVQDRMSLTHFVRSVMKDAPADEASVAEALQKQYGTPAKPKLPIDFTIDLMAQ